MAIDRSATSRSSERSTPSTRSDRQVGSLAMQACYPLRQGRLARLKNREPSGPTVGRQPWARLAPAPAVQRQSTRAERGQRVLTAAKAQPHHRGLDTAGDLDTSRHSFR